MATWLVRYRQEIVRTKPALAGTPVGSAEHLVFRVSPFQIIGCAGVKGVPRRAAKESDESVFSGSLGDRSRERHRFESCLRTGT
jgi:hypothetical protein